jgi:hypothetical protein
MAKQVRNVGESPGAQVVQNRDLVAGIDDRIGQMGADVASAARDQDSHYATSGLSAYHITAI